MRDAVGEGGVSVGGSKRNGDNNTLGCLTLHGTDYLVYQTFFNIFFFFHLRQQIQQHYSYEHLSVYTKTKV